MIRKVVVSSVKKILPMIIRVDALDKAGGFKFWFTIPFSTNENLLIQRAVKEAKKFNHSPNHPWIRDNNRIFYISFNRLIFNMKKVRCWITEEAVKKAFHIKTLYR